MGMQPLSARSIRRIARTTGLDVIHGAANGGYWHAFVTSAHEHGAWHRYTHEWEWTNAACTTSCKQLFPNTPPVRHGEAVTGTPACVCDHDGLPAYYHLDGCPTSGRPLPTPEQAAVIDALAQEMAAAVERTRAAYDEAAAGLPDLPLEPTPGRGGGRVIHKVHIRASPDHPVWVAGPPVPGTGEEFRHMKIQSDMKLGLEEDEWIEIHTTRPWWAED